MGGTPGACPTGIDIPTRELLTFVMLVALDGADAQVKSRAAANLNVRNERGRLIEVLTQLIALIGYPARSTGSAPSTGHSQGADLSSRA
jgi:4-carboxymuconolactone decarboxylase